MSDETPKPKLAVETVLDKFSDGSPHVTVDKQGAVRHYHDRHDPGSVVGQAIGPIPIPVAFSRPAPSRSAAGPARVTSDAYRVGWDSIDWGTKGGGLPS